MSNVRVFAFMAIILSLVCTSSSFATGEIPKPKQEIKFDYSGPHKDLIGLWTGNLRDSLFGARNVTNWDFDLYVISVTEKDATGFYCWGASSNVEPGCRKVQGVVVPEEDKLVFQWGERELKLLRTGKVIYQKGGGKIFDGMATKVEKK